MPENVKSEVYPTMGGYVTVPAKTWDKLCDTVENLSKELSSVKNTVAEQALEIRSQQRTISRCQEDISKLAKITEGIYETL